MKARKLCNRCNVVTNVSFDIEAGWAASERSKNGGTKGSVGGFVERKYSIGLCVP